MEAPVATQPRIIKSHDPYSRDYPKIIYLYRDGRDVAVSYYDYMYKLQDYEKDLSSFLSKMLKDGFEYGTWQGHVKGYLWGERASDVLAISYEELYDNTNSTLHRIRGFLGTTWEERDIEIAIQRSSFDVYQKDLYSHRFATHWSKGFRGGVKGAPGSWRERFSAQQNELFWELAGEVAAKLGYRKE
jgi:hypothetical protein